jgi:hypothetical protein
MSGGSGTRDRLRSTREEVMSTSEENSTYTAQEIADAQHALDHYPDYSGFWESASGQEHLSLALDLGLVAATTGEYRRGWHRAEIAAAREDAE